MKTLQDPAPPPTDTDDLTPRQIAGMFLFAVALLVLILLTEGTPA